MCNLLVKAFKDILKLDFSSREKGKHFQDRIVSILIEKIGKHNRLEKEIITEPNGSQKFPDIILKGWRTDINIEIKRSGKGQIMWNEGFPKNGPNIYILNGHTELGRGREKTLTSGTTFFLGNSVINVDEENMLNEIKIKLKEVTREYVEIAPRKWKLSYLRPQFLEIDPQERSYLIHENRKIRELEVLKFLSEV